MNARTKIHQLHLNEWITRFSEQKASGLTVKPVSYTHLDVYKRQVRIHALFLQIIYRSFSNIARIISWEKEG